jgi:hypothetical protein
LGSFASLISLLKGEKFLANENLLVFHSNKFF